MNPRIPLFEISYDDREIENALDSITRGGYWANGPYIEEFESALESYLGVEHAVTVNSGTSALHCALEAHNIGPGDEVIVPSFTFIATANAVRLAGAEPVFCDIERETYGLDPSSVSDHINDATAAILTVHCYGGGCQIGELASIAAEHDVALIEDAAESFGATVGGQMLATVGDTGVLSFCQNKVITSGEGGAIVTDDPKIARRAERYRSHGRTSESYFSDAKSGEYASLGGNMRMPDMVAAVGAAQLEKVDSLIDQRREVADRYRSRLDDIQSVQPHAVPHGNHVYQLYTVTLDNDVDRESVIDALAANDIASKVYWDPPVHRTKYYEQTTPTCSDLPVTDDIASRVLSLPMYPGLSEAEVGRITSTIQRTVT